MPDPTVFDCAECLRTLLCLGPREVSDVLRTAKLNGYSRRLVRLAKHRLKLRVTSRLEGTKRRFYWQLTPRA